MLSWICLRAVRSRKFKLISFVPTGCTCKLDRGPQSSLFLHWFHLCRIKCPLQRLVIQEVFSTDRTRSGHVSCRPESMLWWKGHLQTCVHKRIHRDCCKWSTLHFTHSMQVACNRVDWKSLRQVELAAVWKSQHREISVITSLDGNNGEWSQASLSGGSVGTSRKVAGSSGYRNCCCKNVCKI